MRKRNCQRKQDTSWVWMCSLLAVFFIGLIVCYGRVCLRSNGAALNAESTLQEIELNNYTPPTLKSLIVHPESDDNYFDFILDAQEETVEDEERLEPLAKQLIDYFFLGITLPSDDLWVNLNSVRQSEITSPRLALTDIGKVLLEADLTLKRDCSRFTDPRTKTGKEYWDNLQRRLNEENLNTTQLPIGNRFWIIPLEATVEEDTQNHTVTIVKSKLKVCLEQENLKLTPNNRITAAKAQTPKELLTQQICDFTMKETILPHIQERVNQAEEYAKLRQVYNSLILAEYYKQKYHNGQGLYPTLINRAHLQGLESSLPWNTQDFYQAYVKSAQEGEYRFSQQEYDPFLASMVKKYYFYGGVTFVQHIARTLHIADISSAISSAKRILVKVFNITSERPWNKYLEMYQVGNMPMSLRADAVDSDKADFIRAVIQIRLDRDMASEQTDTIIRELAGVDLSFHNVFEAYREEGYLRKAAFASFSSKRRSVGEEVQAMVARGLIYQEAVYWRQLKVEQNIRLPRNFWTHHVTAKNMILVTLDTIPGFKTAREANDIKTMAQLYREHVINYRRRDVEKYSDNGQLTFLFEVGGLSGLIVPSRDYLVKTSSPAAVLRFALPGLIDLTNPDALDPLEVELYYWTDQDNARYHILQALDTIPGFKAAREAGDIKTMAQLYREHVINYKAKDTQKYSQNGQQTFFCEVGGLRGLIVNSREYLAKKASPAALLRFALPGLIDLTNPDALDPLEVELYYWTDPENARYHIYQALDTIPGFKAAREAGDIKTMAQLYREHVIGYKAQDTQKYSQNGQRTFFYEVGGLSGLIDHKKDYLAKTGSPAALLRFALPGLIDLTNPDALDPLEVELYYWTDPENARYHIYQALDTIPGFKAAREAGDIKTMAQLYREHVIHYKAKDTEKYSQNGQVTFFQEVGGLRGLLDAPREYLAKKASPAALLRFALPGLIDLTNPDALDPLEAELHYWTDPENARYHIYQALDTIPGFKAAREAGDIKTMAQLYREHVIHYKARDTEKYSQNGQATFFHEAGGLKGLIGHQKDYLAKKASPAALLRFALPGLIDDTNPDALSSSEVERGSAVAGLPAAEDVLDRTLTEIRRLQTTGVRQILATNEMMPGTTTTIEINQAITFAENRQLFYENGKFHLFGGGVSLNEKNEQVPKAEGIGGIDFRTIEIQKEE